MKSVESINLCKCDSDKLRYNQSALRRNKSGDERERTDFIDQPIGRLRLRVL
jgi:hypothetical protein